MKELKNRLKEEYEEEYKNILISFETKKISSLRINTLKSSIEEIKSIFKKENISYKEVEWSNVALLVSEENKIRSLSLYKEGKIYFQNLSSQLPVLFMDLKENTDILDMAAAPGSKTTQIASITKNRVRITALEKNKIRAEKLRYNIERQGAKKVEVLQMDARNIEPYFQFDEILLDAPCSGSGTFSIDTNFSWSEELVKRTKQFQKELLESASKHIKVGGSILYSTCSILKEENEMQISRFLEKHPNFVLEILPLDKPLPYLKSLEGTITIRPTEIYEGFFIAKLRRIK